MAAASAAVGRKDADRAVHTYIGLHFQRLDGSPKRSRTELTEAEASTMILHFDNVQSHRENKSDTRSGWWDKRNLSHVI